MPSDPQTLLDRARCFECFSPEGMLQLAQVGSEKGVVDQVDQGGHNPFIPVKVPAPQNLTFVYDQATDTVVASWGPIPSPTPPITSTYVQVSYVGPTGPWTAFSIVFVPNTSQSFTTPGFGNSAWVRARYINSALATSAWTGPVQVDVPPLNPLALSWAARVVINGGAPPSNNSVVAASFFADALDAAGLTGKISMLNMFAPDSLIAAITPLIVGPGNDPWTNNGPFVAGDLTRFGLKSNGSTKYLDTGVNASAIWPTLNDITMACGIADTDASNNYAISSKSVFSAATAYGLDPNQNGSSFGDIPYGAAGGNRIGGTFPASLRAVASLGIGYFCANRVSNNSAFTYAGNSLTPHAQVGTSGALAVALAPNDPLIAPGISQNVNYSLCRLNFAMFGNGFTQADSSALMDAWLDLRAAFEGDEVDQWLYAISQAGGAAPSATTEAAARTFIEDCRTAGILNDLISVNLIAPDNLIAARTPVVTPWYGNNPWTSAGFVAGDLSVGGLKGGAGKTMETNIFASQFTDLTSVGISAYAQENGGNIASNGTMGCSSFDLSAFIDLSVNQSNATSFYAWTVGASGSVSASSVGFKGFWSGNRIAANDIKLYRANGSEAFNQVASGNNTAGTQPGYPIPAFRFRLNDFSDTYQTDRISFLALHRGFNATKAEALFNAVTTFRQAVGGGYYPLVAPTYPAGTHADAVDWADRVVANGALAYPSVATVTAISNFINALETAGIYSKMRALNVVAPDELAAAITPLVKTEGNDPWTNTGFSSADLSVNGLVGNGAKYLQTGVQGAPINDLLGLTVYAYDAVSGFLIGSSNPGDYNNGVTLQWGAGNIAMDMPYNGGGGRVLFADANQRGYISANSTATNNRAVYRARSTLAHNLAGSSAANQGAIANTTPMFAWAANATSTNPVVGTLSFAAAHSALTQAESLDFFNAIQALRTAFGGGYV